VTSLREGFANNLTVKLASGAASVGYLVALGVYFAPATWHVPVKLVIAICPSALLSMMSMTDPSFGAVACILAPLNAAFYGLLGLLISTFNWKESDPR